MTTEKEYVSPLAAAIEERGRKIHEFDISHIVALPPGKPSRIGVRVPTLKEQDEALHAAYRALEKPPYDKEISKSDEDILRNTKIVHILHVSLVELEPKPGKPGGPLIHYPVFPAPVWMKAMLTTEQIGSLLNLLNEVRAVESAEPRDLDDATLDSLHEVAVSANGGDIATEFLAGCGREFMVRLYVAEAKRLAGARDALIRAQEEIAALKAGREPEESP